MNLSLPIITTNSTPTPQATPIATHTREGQVDLSGEIKFEYQSEREMSQDGPVAFADLLAQLLGAFTHCSSTPQSPTNVDNETNGTQANGSITLTGTLNATAEVEVPAISGSSVREAGLDLSINTEVNTGARIEEGIDTLAEVVSELRTSANTLKQRIGAHLHNHHETHDLEVATNRTLSITGVENELSVNMELSRTARRGLTDSIETEGSLRGSLNIHHDTSEITDTSPVTTPVPLVPTETSTEPSASPSERFDNERTEFTLDTRLAASLDGRVAIQDRHTHVTGHTVAPQHPPTAAPLAHSQLVDAVAPLRHRGDGNYDLTLELHPGELGTVRVRAVLENGTIQLHLQADSPATRDLLQGSLAGLRNALDDVGLNSGQLSVDLQAGWQGTASGSHQQTSQSENDSLTSSSGNGLIDNSHEALDTSPSQPSSTSAVDILL